VRAERHRRDSSHRCGNALFESVAVRKLSANCRDPPPPMPKIIALSSPRCHVPRATISSAPDANWFNSRLLGRTTGLAESLCWIVALWTKVAMLFDPFARIK